MSHTGNWGHLGWDSVFLCGETGFGTLGKTGSDLGGKTGFGTSGETGSDLRRKTGLRLRAESQYQVWEDAATSHVAGRAATAQAAMKDRAGDLFGQFLLRNGRWDVEGLKIAVSKVHGQRFPAAAPMQP